MRRKITFEDKGQDFLWWIIEGDTVVDCGPFQGHIWRGLKVLNPDAWPRERVVFLDQNGVRRTIKYPVVSNEVLP